MPADPNTIAAVSDGINTVANTISTNDINRRTQRFSREMYDKTRKDNLADWEMQNAYNSPAAQMQRLKDAGLNPHLVYGKGADAQSSAPPRSADTPSWNPKAIDLQTNMAQNALSNYYAIQNQQATTDNLRVQKTVLENEAMLKSIQAVATLSSSDKTREETTNIQLLRETTIEAARKNIEKLSADIDQTKTNTFYTLQENMRKQQLQPVTIQHITEQIKHSQENRKLSENQRQEIQHRIQNLVKEGTIKDFEIKLNQMGIKPSDPLWQRKLTEMLNEAAKPIKETLKGNFKVEKRKPPQTLEQFLHRLSPA